MFSINLSSLLKILNKVRSIFVSANIAERYGKTKMESEILLLDSKWKYIIIHHSWTEDGITADWDAIRRYHKEVNGWQDIGYHFGLEVQNGDIVVRTGRPLTMDGAHTLHFNDKSIGICVIGNYDQNPPEATKLAFLRVFVRGLMITYNIPVNHVLGHRETYPLLDKPVEKTCPGSRFSMVEFRDTLA